MKKLLITVGLLATLTCLGSAQLIATESGKRSDEIFLKLRKIDVLNMLLPLLLTKDQINNGVLPAVESARAKQKQVLANEDAELAKLETQVNEVYDDAIKKNKYPSKEFTALIAAKTREMSMKRSFASTQITQDLAAALDKVLDAGQKKVMEGSFDANYIDPGKKSEDIPATTKRLFFIQKVFLDPLSRELLIAIAEHAS